MSARVLMASILVACGTGNVAKPSCASAKDCGPNEACVEQIGGPAARTNPPRICIARIPGCLGGAIVCSCIPGQGNCSQSQSEPGICVCDNGIR
jgi:hypothetical protein